MNTDGAPPPGATLMTDRDRLPQPRLTNRTSFMTTDVINRFFGGPPLAVIARLILLSILVGVVLHAIGLDPWNIFDSLRRFLISIWNMGFDAVKWVWRYFLLGAALVIPIWLIVRLVRTTERR
jgi:hypothetical protein